MKKTVVIISLSIMLLSIFGAAVNAEENQIGAVERVRMLAEKEKEECLVSGVTKIVGGAVLIAGGMGIQTAGNLVSQCFFLPLSLAIQTGGAISAVEGAGNMVAGSNKFEKDYNAINALEPEKREIYASHCLKVRAEEARTSRKPNLENLFGLLSLNESQAEKEYKAYLQEQEQLYSRVADTDS